VSFAIITLCVASKGVFIVGIVYFVIDLVERVQVLLIMFVCFFHQQLNSLKETP
jgi:hypothetical protein